MLYLELKPTINQRERLRRRLRVLSADEMPELGLVQIEDRYVERSRQRANLMTIYLLLTGPARGEFFKLCEA